MANKYLVQPINKCFAKKCNVAATKIVTNLDGYYPVKTCDSHIGLAKKRVTEIQNS